MVLFPQSLRIGLAALALLAATPAGSQVPAEAVHPKLPETGRPPEGWQGAGAYTPNLNVTLRTFDLHGQAGNFTSPGPDARSDTAAADTGAAPDSAASSPVRTDPSEAARAAVEQYLDDLPVVRKHRRPQ